MAEQQAGDALAPRVRGDVDIAEPRPPGPGLPIHAVARPEAGDADGIAVFERDEAARERAGPIFGEARARFIAGSAAAGPPFRLDPARPDRKRVALGTRLRVFVLSGGLLIIKKKHTSTASLHLFV